MIAIARGSRLNGDTNGVPARRIRVIIEGSSRDPEARVLMRLDRLFRVSFYVSLGTATVTLALSESFFLPWLPYAIPGLLLVLALAWWKDGAWVLSETGANYLG